MKAFTVPAILTKVSSLADRGLGLSFHTSELSNEEKVGVMEYHNLSGWLMFSPNPIEDKDIPKENAEVNTKTPSQRLRAVLYVFWQQQGIKGDFETFYRAKIEQIINDYKSQLL